MQFSHASTWVLGVSLAHGLIWDGLSTLEAVSIFQNLKGKNLVILSRNWIACQWDPHVLFEWSSWLCYQLQVCFIDLLRAMSWIRLKLLWFKLQWSFPYEMELNWIFNEAELLHAASATIHWSNKIGQITKPFVWKVISWAQSIPKPFHWFN